MPVLLVDVKSIVFFYVFRRSEAILTKTLPQKEEYVIPVKMTSIQMSLYKSFVSSVKNYVGYINPIKAFGICIKVWGLLCIICLLNIHIVLVQWLQVSKCLQFCEFLFRTGIIFSIYFARFGTILTF